jgi:opacity protein-like surface antigen
MKKLLAALALASLIASPALAAPWLNPSYDCAPAQYDSSGAPVAKYCE